MKTKLRELPAPVNATRDPLIAEMLAEQRKIAAQLGNVSAMLAAVIGQPPPTKALATIEQLCDSLKITRSFLATLRAEGLPQITVSSGAVRFDIDDVIAWLKMRGQP